MAVGDALARLVQNLAEVQGHQLQARKQLLVVPAGQGRQGPVCHRLRGRLHLRHEASCRRLPSSTTWPIGLPAKKSFRLGGPYSAVVIPPGRSDATKMASDKKLVPAE